MKLGIMDHVIDAKNEQETFQQAKELGLAGIEVGLRRADLRDPNQARLARITQAQAATGLAVPSLVLGEHNHGGIGSADPAVVNAACEDIRQAIEWAAELGAQVILLPFFGPAELKSDQDRQRTAQAFRELCAVAAPRGVALCYEGMLPAEDIRHMAEQVNSPAFGCYFDLANAAWLGFDPAEEIRSLGPLVKQVHMKEWGEGKHEPHPGEGQVNYTASAEALREIGYNGWLILETPSGTPDSVAQDIAFTKRYFS